MLSIRRLFTPKPSPHSEEPAQPEAAPAADAVATPPPALDAWDVLHSAREDERLDLEPPPALAHQPLALDMPHLPPLVPEPEPVRLRPRVTPVTGDVPMPRDEPTPTTSDPEPSAVAAVAAPEAARPPDRIRPAPTIVPAGTSAASVPPLPALDTTRPVGVFGIADLPAAANLPDSLSRLLRVDDEDAAYVHAPEVPVDFMPEGVVEGRNLFGPGQCPPVMRNPRGVMRSVATASLHDVIFSGRSTALQSVARGLFAPSVAAIGGGNYVDALPSLEPFYKSDGAGALVMGAATLPTLDAVAIPVCGVGIDHFEYFLYDGLPVAWMLRRYVAEMPIALVGRRLAGWQEELLLLLGIADIYVTVDAPVRFTRALVSDLMSTHIPYPTRYVRPLFDTLRFVVGGAAAGSQRAVFLSRPHGPAGAMSNRPEVEAALAEIGVEIVVPETLTVRERIAVAASARLVIGESGSAMANIGFCDPGASVLEIQGEAGPDIWSRAACRLLGLRWHLYVAAREADATTASKEAAPSGRFTVDIPSLIEAVQTIRATA